jgi:hypothetical protein
MPDSERTVVSEPAKSEYIHILIVALLQAKSNDESHKMSSRGNIAMKRRAGAPVCIKSPKVYSGY